MNLLFLNSARAWGGNEKWTVMAASALAAGHHVVLAYRKEEVGSRFSGLKYQLAFRHEADIETIVKLVTLVRKHRIDVMIPTKRKDYALAGMVCRICGIKNVLRLGIVRDLENRMIYNLVYNRLADGIIVNARKIKDVLLRSSYMRPEKIRVIYNGIDAAEVVAKAEADPQRKPFGFVVASMGELSERKGFHVLLEAFAVFVREENADDAGLLIIGEGKNRDALQSLARKLGIERQVLFTGFLANPWPWLASGDVFVMASDNEGISNALLEAAVLGSALVSTRAGGAEEVLMDRDNCLLADPGSSSQIAGCLQLLYRDPALRLHLAERAFRMVNETFSMKRMTDEMIDFFNSITGR